MSDVIEIDDLIAHLGRSTALGPAEAARIVAEVIAFLDETPEAFVQRRHRALQAEGLGNEAIFARISMELLARRFKAPAYTARQIRRIVYG